MKILSPKAPLWNASFRPFFLMVLLLAITLTPIWVSQITGFTSFDFSPLTPIQWHSNEMIFGFLTAAIIGFLLTASANWTGTRGINGIALQLIFFSFLTVRLIFLLTPFQNLWVYQWIAGIIPFCLIIYLARLFIKTKNFRNLIIIAPLIALFFGQMYSLGPKHQMGYELALYAVRFILVVIAGRMIPLFTQKSLGLAPKWKIPLMEKLTILTTFLLIFEPFYRGITEIGDKAWVVLTASAFILNALRFASWRFFASFKEGILLILYIAYLWLPIHFALNLANHFGWIPALGKPAIHSLAYGCLGTMILGIIHRVTLGHTGNPIRAKGWAKLGYALIVLGSLTRVFAPLVLPKYYLQWISVSGIFWILAFLLVGSEMIPKLFSQRADA